MTDSDHLFMPRHQHEPLRRDLTAIPGLVEDLAVTLTLRAHIAKPGQGGKRPRPESRMPLHLGASEAASGLHSCLVGWVRLVCEPRGLTYDGGTSTAGLARWLHRHLIPLAMTEGSQEAPEDIRGHIVACRTVIDLPPEDQIMVDRSRVRAANRTLITRDTVEVVARRIGVAGLNARRLRTLEKRGLIRATSQDRDSGTLFYRLGDVLRAHESHERKGA